MRDDSTHDGDFAETKGIWWAGIAFASIVTFAAIGGLLTAGTYVLNETAHLDISFWMPTVVAAILTAILIRVSVTRGTLKYEPR